MAVLSSREWRDQDRGGRLPGQGRSAGFRMLTAYRARTRSVFLFGFAKSERENIEDDELATLRDIARGWFAANAMALARAITDGVVQEVEYDPEEEN